MPLYMRNILCLILVISPLLSIAQVGIGTNSPHASAQLEVKSSGKGLLPPRVALQGTDDATKPTPTIANPIAGLLVYNTAPAGTGANAVTPGFYYYSGSAWVRLIVPTDNATNVTGTVAIANGGTNATDAATARTNLGLGNVNNTSDANKPISTATQTALDSKAPINNPTFTGTVGGITKSMVGLSNVDNTSDANKPVSTSTQTALDLKENSSNKSNSTSLGTSDVLYPTQNAVKAYVDAQTTSDASSTVKGKVQLAGDLTGTAALPVIANGAINSAKLADGAITTTKITNANITTDKIADAAITDAKIATVSGSKVSGNISGNATNVTGTVAIANGGTGGIDAATARTNLGATTVGSNLFTLPDQTDIRFPRINANNTVSTLTDAEFRTAIGAGTSSTTGTVTSVATGNGITGGTITNSGTIGLTGQALALHNLSSNGLVARTAEGAVSARTITGTANQITVSNGDGVSGNPTLSLANGTAAGQVFVTGASPFTPTLQSISGDATLSAAGVLTIASGAVALGTDVSGTLPVANGGTGATDAATARTNLGATTVGSNLFTLSNPSAITFPRFNADNTVTALSAIDFRTAIGAGTGNGTVTSIGLTTGTSGTNVNVSGSPVTGSGTITLNIPDASAEARGLVTTGAQTFAGAKTFSAAPVLSTATASQALFTDGSKNVVSNSISGTGSVVMSNAATLTIPKINTSGSAASTAGAGAMRYNSSSSNLEYSNGSSWRPLATVEVDNTYKLASTGTARSVNISQAISSGSFVTLNNSSITVVVPSGFSDTRIILQWNVWGEVKANAAATGSIRYQILQTSPTSSTIGSVMMTGWSISSGSVTRFSAPVGWIIENAVAGTYTFQLQMNRESESGNAPFDFLNWGVAGTGQVFVR